MNLAKFKDFLEMVNEATTELSILDCVIDDKGQLYNGVEGELNKGRIERLKVGVVNRILGVTDNIEYPAGIDRNGNLVTKERDEDGYAIHNGEKINIPAHIRSTYRINDYYWRVFDDNGAVDYSKLVPVTPTGWVNIKVDMEIVKRVSRYSKALGSNNRGHQSFLSKLEEFSRMSSLERGASAIKRLKRATIQREMASIILLHYINEVKEFFNPSQAGFLFESFLAGLIPNAKVVDDNSPVDLRAGNDRYQVKFLDFKADYCEITKDYDPLNPIAGRVGRVEYLEHYIICQKFVDRIDIYVIDGDELRDNLNDIKSPGGAKGEQFKIKSIVSNPNRAGIKKFEIGISKIEERISNLGISIKDDLNKLYTELSKFQYNLETVITGIDEKGKPVRSQEEFGVYQIKAEENIKQLGICFKEVISDINK